MVLLVIFSIILSMTVFAADALCRFMHNDHDALIIGEITKVNGNTINVSVLKSISSAKDLRANEPKKQLNIKSAIITGVNGYAFYYKDIEVPIITPKVGDYVLASLVKKNNAFSVAWGLYKVDKTDYKTLSILYPDYISTYSKMDAAAIKAFVNSDGKLTEFAFDGDTGTVISQEDGTVIYDGSKTKQIENNVVASTTSNTSKTSSENTLKNIIAIATICVFVIIGIVIFIRKKKK